MKPFRKPLVSIGIPVCNGVKYIKESIDAICNQTYKNLEIVISDDKSDDGSYEYLKILALKDKRIKLIRQNKKIGQVRNFNFVLQKSTGKYFCWAAQDDIHHKDFIQELLSLMEEDPFISLAMCDYRNIYQQKKYKIYDKPAVKFNNLADSLGYLLDNHNLSLFYGLHNRKTLIKNGGYHTDCRPFFYSSDFLTIFKSLLTGKLGYCDRILFLKRDSGYFTRQFEHLKNDNIFSLKKHIFRYLLFPVHYIFDFIYALYYLVASDLNIIEKTKLSIKLIKCEIMLFTKYFINIIIGFKTLISRIIKI